MLDSLKCSNWCDKTLLNQGLPICGHDESESSLNKGNFFEVLSWYRNRCENIKPFVLENAPTNNKLTSPNIQKELVTACEIATLKSIMEDLNGDYFALLVDESFDGPH